MLIGEDALLFDKDPLATGPRFTVALHLSEPGDFYMAGGDVLSVVDGVKSVGRAWLDLVEEMSRLHPEQAGDVRAAALGVLASLRGHGCSFEVSI